MKTTILRPVFAAIAVLLLCSCEHDAKDKWEDVKDKTGLSSKNDDTVTGLWSGTSGSGMWSTRMTLTENNGTISGTMRWISTGDSRSVGGTRSGKNVTLFIGGGDVWHLKLSGDKMTGSGDKYGTNRTYALSFTR